MTNDINEARLRRIRRATRAILWLGIAVSVGANILHARDNAISQAIAAWPPFSLFVTTELLGWVPGRGRARRWARMSATAAIAGIAAWVSYWHMAGVASRYGEAGAAPYLLPLSVDGLIVVASVSLVEIGALITEAREAKARAALAAASEARARASTPEARGTRGKAPASPRLVKRAEARGEAGAEARRGEASGTGEARRGELASAVASAASSDDASPPSAPGVGHGLEGEALRLARLASLVEWRGKLGGVPPRARDHVKARLGVGSKTADQLLASLASLPAEIEATPEAIEGYLSTVEASAST